MATIKTKELKMRKGPFKGRRWSEIQTSELLATINQLQQHLMKYEDDAKEELLFDLTDRLNSRAKGMQ
jgi:hypothetical protein